MPESNICKPSAAAPRFCRWATRIFPFFVRSRGGENPVYILSEPDLLNNHGLAHESAARSAVAIVAALRKGNGPVMLDVTLNGLGRTSSPLKMLSSRPSAAPPSAPFWRR